MEKDEREHKGEREEKKVAKERGREREEKNKLQAERWKRRF